MLYGIIAFTFDRSGSGIRGTGPGREPPHRRRDLASDGTRRAEPAHRSRIAPENGTVPQAARAATALAAHPPGRTLPPARNVIPGTRPAACGPVHRRRGAK